MKNKIWIIVRREYLERVKKKSFIITTILMPVLMLAMMCLPALLMNLNISDARRIGVVDNSGIIAPQLNDTDLARYERIDVAPDSMYAHTEYDGFLIIASDIVDNPKGVNLYTRDASSMELENSLNNNISDIIEQERLKAIDKADVRDIMDSVKANVNISTFRLSESEEAAGTSSMISYAIGMIMSVVLYMFLLMYGQMVMTSIIEEKNNRVLELMVTSVKPTQLMMGKIIGVGLVAVTQLALWALLMVTLSASFIPLFISPEIAGEIAAYKTGTLDIATSSVDIEGIQALSIMGNPTFIAGIFGYLLLFLVGGFLLYAAMYAAIGSSVDNIQDGSQLQSFVIIPLLIGFIVSTTIAANPTSSLAVWLSMIPFTSPMVMMTRIPFGIPTWEIIVSLIILYASFVAIVWFAAKIYRVGIFMHGKKPTVRQLIQWARYK
ncbi:MAG: ABC transporter permease [Muribaculaceae bacterium]|nr:ABC transporter permease [Muribaculaceae bacterium]